MRKRFVAKKKKKHKWKIRYIIYILCIYLGYQVTSGVLLQMKLTTTNEDFLLAMMKDSNHHLLYEKSSKNLVAKATKFLTGIDMKNPASTIEQVFHYDTKKEKKSGLEHNIETNEADNKNIANSDTKYVSDPKPETNITNPRVYIYNTHQLENYSMKNLEAYNITPNVMMASYLLREKLNDQSIPTIVEENNVNDFLNLNAWAKKDAYKATREFMKNAMTQYQNLDLLIDLHRDAIPKASSTITIDGKNYAKVLFVVGLNNPNYQTNLDLSNQINQRINQKYPGLTRGVLTKQGAGVNGVYNQDMSNKAILIECGGYENTIDEVSNTIEALSIIIKEYLGGTV